jgi:hypothetical protein
LLKGDFLELNYDVDIKASLDEIRQTLTIEGQAIDTSVNENNWQVPSEDIDYFVSTLKNAQLRINHGTNVEDVKGVVKTVKRVDNTVLFSAEVSGDPVLLTQIEKKYLNMVSPKVVSDEIVCSKCGEKTRNENLGMIHLCSGAYEVVHKPQCVELSIVAVGAYKNNIFKPRGFAAAMNESQRQALIASKCRCLNNSNCPCGISQLKSKVQLAKNDEFYQENTTGEKNKLSEEKKPEQEPPAPDSNQAPKAGTELTYEQFQQELEKNTATIMNACKTAIADSTAKLEAQLANEVKAAVSAMIPKIAAKPTGKGIIAAPDDAQKLNNMFAKKANLRKAGLELAAAAKRMDGLTADITHTEEEVTE